MSGSARQQCGPNHQKRISGGDATCDIGAFEGYIQLGATFTANTTDPILNGACRSIYCPLGDAINAANDYNGGHANAGATINLANGATYALNEVDNTPPQGANGLPVIYTKITIDGNGASIGRDGTISTAFRIFQVNGGGTVNLDQTTFSYNAANTGGANPPRRAPSGITPSGGGAVYNVGTLSILASTFNLNNATDGGAIDNGGTLSVTNSTFNGNGSTNLGGAIFNGAGSHTAINDTLAGDSALKGGEIAVGGGAATLKDTIVADSSKGSNCYGGITNGGHNLDSGKSCQFGKQLHSLSNANPHLGALGNNGGPTKTLALLKGSAAFRDGDKAVPGGARY